MGVCASVCAVVVTLACICVWVCVSVLRYVLIRRESRAPQTPRILLVGPPGSGKSLQARRLADKYKLVDSQFHFISMGSFINEGQHTLKNIAVHVDNLLERG